MSNSTEGDVKRTGYTRAQLADAVDEAHMCLHRAASRFDRGHKLTAEDFVHEAIGALHRVGAGLERVGCASPDPEEMPLPCGHRMVDLIGGVEPDTGRPCVTKCGACISLRQEEIAAKRVAANKARRELEAAIRAITVDMPDDQPNGPAERALLDLEEALGGFPWRDQAIDAARTAAAKLCEALADDTRRLRLAAEDYLGGDFSKPAHEPS